VTLIAATTLAVVGVSSLAGTLAVAASNQRSNEDAVSEIDSALKEYDAAYLSADCEMFTSVTTNNLRREQEVITCVDFQMTARAISGRTTEWNTQISRIIPSGDTAYALVANRYTYDGKAQIDVWSSDLIRIDGQWKIDSVAFENLVEDN
jgi:hypothetical protein